MQARPLWTPTSKAEVELFDWSQLQVAAAEGRAAVRLKWLKMSKYQQNKPSVPSVAPASDRDTRRLVDRLSPFPLNATS